jgi:DMSO/TMAO reductase YedYZ molybdopterin-dependent catalytic subunit
MRKLRKSSFVYPLVLVGLLSTLLAGCGRGTPNVDWELQVSGDVASPLTLSYEDLTEMPQVELNDILMERSTGENVVTNWSGVSVAEILREAGAPEVYTSVTAFAADGYAIEITSDELAEAIVALKDGREWIADATPDKGPIRLVCPQTPGNRWVFQLMELQVNE